MKAEKWNPKTEEYEPYELPEGAVLCSENLNDKINCACCGKELIYGNSYCSRRIHSFFGFAYFVCDKCHEQEIREEFEHIRSSKNERNS